MATKQERRLHFNGVVAPRLVQALGITSQATNEPNRMFAHWEDDDRFIVVAGEQEGRDVQKALARGLGLRHGRKLILILPERHTLATLLRSAWLIKDARPDVYLHNGERLLSSADEPVAVPSKKDTTGAFVQRLIGTSLQGDFDDSTIPKHLGSRSSSVIDLVEWATTDSRLDAAHLRSMRSWHHMGLKVLSMESGTAGLRITAGVHYSKADMAPTPVLLAGGDSLAPEQLRAIQEAVEAGISVRSNGHLHKPDEHWLQAVIRQDPSLVGVEQPALRELPTWRPHDKPTLWGRGYADLVGLDGHGDIRVVETKVVSNADELLILQGLDYYMWATAYRSMLGQRLGSPKGARLELHYVIGADPNDKSHPHPHAMAQVASLDPNVPWRFQTIHGWFTNSPGAARPRSRLLPAGDLPG